MNLQEAIASLRAQLGDVGAIVTTTGAAGVADEGDAIVPVATLTGLAVNGYVVIGEGPAMSGHRIVDTDDTPGALTITVSPILPADIAAYTPISAPGSTDAIYEAVIIRGVREYSRYRPLIKALTVDLIASTGTYDLPADFVAPDQASFDMAIGRRSSISNSGGYYALIYDAALRGTTTGYGGSQGLPMIPYGFVPNVNSGVSLAAPSTFTFNRTNPPTLTVTPAPTQAQAIPFFYTAMHTPPGRYVDVDDTGESTVPLQDESLPLLYANYLLYERQASAAAGLTEYKLENETMKFDKAPGYYQALASTSMTLFDQSLRFAPYGVMG